MKNGWGKKKAFHFHEQKRELPLRQAGHDQALLDLGVCKDQMFHLRSLLYAIL